MQPFDYIRNKVEERRAKREQETSADRASRRTANATVWMAIFTFVLMLVGVGTILTGAGTLWILKNQLQEMQEEQRAWIGLQSIGTPTGFTEHEALGVEVVFFNSGRTPAHNVQTSFGYVASPVPVTGPSFGQIEQLQFRHAESIPPQDDFRQTLGVWSGAQPSTDFQKQGEEHLCLGTNFSRTSNCSCITSEFSSMTTTLVGSMRHSFVFIGEP